MHRYILAAMVMLVFSAGSASAQKVNTDFDKSVDFAKFKTYYWPKADITGNSIVDGRVRDAIDQQLKAKGWQKAEGQGAIAVVVHGSTKEQHNLNTFYDGYGGGWGYRGWGGMGMGSSTTTVSTYLQGTMVVDMFDTSNKQLVWRGTATDTISDNPEKNAKKITKAAEKLFKKNFPPQPAGTK